MVNRADAGKMYARLGVYAAATVEQHVMESGEFVCPREIIVADAARMVSAYLGGATPARFSAIVGVIASLQGIPQKHERGSAPKVGTPGYRATPAQCRTGAALAKLDIDLALGTYRGIEVLLQRALPNSADPVRDYLTVLSVMES